MNKSYVLFNLLFSKIKILLSFFIIFVFSTSILVLANLFLNLKLKLLENQVLTYQQANYYYIPFIQTKKGFNSQERIIFSVKNLKNNGETYTNEYTINTFISQNFKQDSLNLINNFLLKGFKVIFVMKSNYELIYSPEIIYFYENLPDYEKNKNLVQDLKNNEYFLNIAKNSITWMKPLNDGELISEYQDGYVKFNIKVNYNFIGYKTIDLNKRLAKLNTMLYKAEGRVLSVNSNLNLFNGLELVDSQINSFEYYEKDTHIPVLLQRELKMKFNIIDDNFRKEYYKNTGSKYFQFELLRTLMLVSK
jgi:hypothetical protein